MELYELRGQSIAEFDIGCNDDLSYALTQRVGTHSGIDPNRGL